MKRGYSSSMGIEIRDSTQFLKKLKKGTLVQVLRDLGAHDGEEAYKMPEGYVYLTKGYYVIQKLYYHENMLGYEVYFKHWSMTIMLDALKEHVHDWIRVVDNPTETEKVLYGSKN